MPFSSALLLLPLLVLFAAVPFVLTLRKSAMAESPWFWAYFFGMFALVALSFAGPKFRARQGQLEKQYQGRQQTLLQQNGQELERDAADSESTIVTLWPLYAGLSAATVIAWVVYWRTSHTAAGPTSSAPSNS
jgi:hypothetical protein